MKEKILRRERHRQTDRQRHRDRDRDRQRETETERQAETETDRQRERERSSLRRYNLKAGCSYKICCLRLFLAAVLHPSQISVGDISNDL